VHFCGPAWNVSALFGACPVHNQQAAVQQYFTSIWRTDPISFHTGLCTLGHFPFNGLTGQTQIVFLGINGKIWSMFLKYLAKMDLIQMLSKFSG
jgi:hypothetical protein